MLQVGSLVDGRYKILSEIGHGGMSVVYMAINEKANKTWAVKEVRKDGKLDFNTVRAGLMAEIETLKKLNHPNLPSIVDVIEDQDSFIIVMDYIEGRSLDVILEETGAQSEDNVVEWAIQLCDVFGYLHSRTPPIIYRLFFLQKAYLPNPSWRFSSQILHKQELSSEQADVLRHLYL